MQRCAQPVIPAPYIKSLFLEEVHGYGLITLCSHVHDVDPEVVLLVNIRSVFHQQLDQVDVAAERCEVEGCETVVVRLVVDPLVDLLLGHCVQGALHQFSTDLLQILKGCHMHQGVPSMVDDVHDRHSWVFLYLSHQTQFISRFDELKRSLSDFSDQMLIDPRLPELPK